MGGYRMGCTTHNGTSDFIIEYSAQHNGPRLTLELRHSRRLEAHACNAYVTQVNLVLLYALYCGDLSRVPR